MRHGVTAANREGRFLGRSDPTLDDEGMAQAQRLRGRVQRFDPHRIVSSPARRATQTAAEWPIGPVIEDEAFREIDFGLWEGLTRQEVAGIDPEGIRAFDHGEIEGFPEGETVAAVRDRTVTALETHESERLMVVTHATVIRILVVALMGLPVSHYRSILDRPGNCSWTELHAHDRGWRLVRYGAEAPLVHGVDRSSGGSLR